MDWSDFLSQARTALGTGDPAVTVAVLDGPVDTSHPCFAGARLEFPLGQPSFSDASAAARHGTHIASMIFGRGGGVFGLAPDARGIVVPVFTSDAAACSQIDLARGIGVALDHGAQIINISGGQLLAACEPDGYLSAALTACEAQGVLVVAATGNNGGTKNHLPACIETVLAVGALDRQGRRLSSGNWSTSEAAHGVLAPGEAVAGAAPGGGVTRGTGTSFATAIASGFAARRLADRLSGGGSNDALAVRSELRGAVITTGLHGNRSMVTTAFQRFHTDNGGRGKMAISDLDFSSMDPATAGSSHVMEIAQPAIGPSGDAIATVDSGPNDRAVTASCADGKPCTCKGGGKDCGCGCGGVKSAEPAQLVYALGQIGFDFGTEARRDSIRQFMPEGTPLTPETLIAHLKDPDNILDVERVTWTLTMDGSPLYALRPAGAFAAEGYAQIFTAFEEQTLGRVIDPGKKGKAEERELVGLFAVPGQIAGSQRLMTGDTVPIVLLASRGLVAWDADKSIMAFAKRFAATGADGESEKVRGERLEQLLGFLRSFLPDYRNHFTRRYRNLGLSGRERALNFAGTASFRALEFLEKAAGLKLVLDALEVQRSPSCRTGSECYDVKLRLFRESDITAAIHVFQFTVDVSSTIPVAIGVPSTWRERP